MTDERKLHCNEQTIVEQAYKKSYKSRAAKKLTKIFGFLKKARALAFKFVSVSPFWALNKK